MRWKLFNIGCVEEHCSRNWNFEKEWLDLGYCTLLQVSLFLNLVNKYLTHLDSITVTFGNSWWFPFWCVWCPLFMMTQLKLTPEQSGFFVKRLLVMFSLTTWNSFSKQKKVVSVTKKKIINLSQCENWKIFLSVIFYVKSFWWI